MSWARQSLTRLIGAGVVATTALVCTAASARSQAEVHYSKAQAFSTALRYLRVDLGYTVTEKDAEAAYLMFEYPRTNQKKQSFGSIEIVDTTQLVKVVVRVPDLPEYQERVLADGLLEKLKSEYGEPPPRKPPTEQKPSAPPSGKKKEADPPTGKASP